MIYVNSNCKLYCKFSVINYLNMYSVIQKDDLFAKASFLFPSNMKFKHTTILYNKRVLIKTSSFIIFEESDLLVIELYCPVAHY